MRGSRWLQIGLIAALSACSGGDDRAPAAPVAGSGSGASSGSEASSGSGAGAGAGSGSAALLQAARRIAFSGNGAVTRVDLPALLAVAEVFELDDNDALEGASAPLLASTLALDITRNPALTSLELPALSSITDRVKVADNTRLRSCALRALVDRLATAPETTTISGNDDVSSCP